MNNNYNELNKHKKRDNIKWIAILMTIIILIVSISAALTQGFTNTNHNGLLDKNMKNESISEDEFNKRVPVANDLEMITDTENGLFLYYGEASSDGDYLTKTITATVLPSDAPDKTMEWSIAWVDETPLASSDISSYLTITPSPDEVSVIVTCKKGFEGSQAVITCTTKIGGFKATCFVNYVGAPEIITVNMDDILSSTDSAWGVSMYELSCGKTYSLDLGLDNTLHQVGSSFGNYTLSLEAHGGIIYRVYSKDSSGNITATNTTGTMLAHGSGTTIDTDGNVYADIQIGNTFGQLLDCRIENGKLILFAQDAPTGLECTLYGRSGSAVHKYESFVDNKCLYYTLTITENTSGITKTINFKSIANVTGVNLSQTSLTF